MFFDAFLLKSLLAALMLACISGPLGCVTVWKGMARFGETFAHVALFGAVIAILGGILPGYGMILVALLLALLLPFLTARTKLSIDSLLGILAPSSVALALILVQQTSISIDFEALLFGELLAVTNEDLVLIAIGIVFIGILLYYLWSPIILDVLSRDLALSEGLPMRLYDVLMTAGLGLFIALGVKIAGLLLINAFLVVPASCLVIFSRHTRLAQSPERMAIGSVLLNCICVFLGLFLAVLLDLPAGASICATLFMTFCAISAFFR